MEMNVKEVMLHVYKEMGKRSIDKGNELGRAFFKHQAEQLQSSRSSEEKPKQEYLKWNREA